MVATVYSVLFMWSCMSLIVCAWPACMVAVVSFCGVTAHVFLLGLCCLCLSVVLFPMLCFLSVRVVSSYCFCFVLVSALGL